MGFSWLDWWRFLGCLMLATLALCLSAAVGTELMEWVKERARARKSKCRQDDRETQTVWECREDDAVMCFHGPKDSVPFCANSNCKHNIKDHCSLRNIMVKCLDYKPEGERHDD